MSDPIRVHSDHAVVSFASLARWGLADLVQREQRRDQLMAEVPMPEPTLLEVLRCQWAETLQRSSGERPEQWLARLGLQQEDADALAARPWRWQRFCEQRFSAAVRSTFLARKAGLDQVAFWRLELADAELAAELHQQLREQETSFEQLAAQARDGEPWAVERVGPVALEALPPELTALLRTLQPGELRRPLPVASRWQLVRLEQRWPAVLDQPLRTRLLAELGEQLLEQLSVAAP